MGTDDIGGGDGQVVAGYKPLSVLAMIAACAGAASALALVSPVAWAVPILAIVLALAALWDVAARDAEPAAGAAGDRKKGRWLAIAGLALAAGFGAQAVAGFVTSRSVARMRSVAAGRMFLDLVLADRMADATKCCLPQVLPMMPSRRSMMEPPPTPEQTAQQAEGALRGMEVIQSIKACGADVPIDLRSVGPEPRMPDSWAVEVRVGPCAGGKSLRLRMLMQSRPVTRGQRLFDNWMVAGIARDVGQ